MYKKEQPAEPVTIEIEQPDIQEIDHQTSHPDDYDNVKDQSLNLM